MGPSRTEIEQNSTRSAVRANDGQHFVTDGARFVLSWTRLAAPESHNHDRDIDTGTKSGAPAGWQRLRISGSEEGVSKGIYRECQLLPAGKQSHLRLAPILSVLSRVNPGLVFFVTICFPSGGSSASNKILCGRRVIRCSPWT